MTRKEETREDFCALCVVGPLAFAGAGATAIGSKMTKKHKKWRTMLLVSGISTVVISLLVLAYYMLFKKDCQSCKL